jgi:hypothetical protein
MHQRQCENVCDLAVEFARLIAAGAVLPMQNEAEPVMTRFAVATTATVLLGCWPQVGGMGIFPGPALGMTSPLGVGPGSPVAPTRIPMGATELTSSGVSPLTSGASPLGLAIGGIATCSGAGGSLPQASPGMGTSMPGTSFNTGMSTAGTVGSTTIFDGGGTSGSASGTCAGTAGAPSAGSAAPSTGMGSTSSVSRLGIPLGSTEIGVGGLSPPSVALTPNPLAPLMTLTPLVVTPNPTAPLSTLGSTAPCLTTGTGTLSIAGGPSTFGSPLATGIPPTAGMGTSTSC